MSLIKLNEIAIDTYSPDTSGSWCASMHKETGIRIIHLPTGTITKCHSERSQHRNREFAMKELESKLLLLKEKAMSVKYLPKVGEKCIYSLSNTMWEEAEVKAISGNEVWLKDESGDAIVDINQCYFRPKQTISLIEREKAIEHMVNISPYDSPKNFKEFSEALYAAGYHNGPKVGSKVQHIARLSDELYTVMHSRIKLDSPCMDWLDKNFDIYWKIKDD